MRIDLTSIEAGHVENESKTAQVNGKETASSGLVAGQDRTTFSSAPQSVKGLVKEAMASSEVRHEMVSNLKHAVQSGKYELDPGKIAQSIIDENA